MTSVYSIPSPNSIPILERITGNTVTTIVDATDESQRVAWFQINHHVSASTPNLTVDIYDGTNAHYVSDDAGNVMNTFTVTAKKGYIFSQGYSIPKGSLLRVTSSDADGEFHVIGVQLGSFSGTG